MANGHALPQLLDCRQLREELGVTRAAAESIIVSLSTDSNQSPLLSPDARESDAARGMNRRRDVETAADLWRGPDDELLNAREAAVLLTVKQSTLLAWARERRVPVVRLGPRHLRWTRPLLREIRDTALDPGRRI
jgi:excisionase family DNA binding protein